MSDRWIGLDIGGTKCAVLLAEVDRGIRILDKARFETHSERGFEDGFGRLCAAIDGILAGHGLEAGDIRGIGISCGGPLDARRGVILNPPNLPGWENAPIAPRLQARYGVPAFLENDANACALVEWKLGAGRGVDDMVFLTMGTGLGAGIIAGGRLLGGSCDMAGEVGHIRMTPEGPVGHGKAGSMEGYASGGGMDRQARDLTRERMAAGDPPAWIRHGHDLADVNTGLMADYARRGDAQAQALFDRAGGKLGEGLAILADTLNPRRIVIGSVFVRCEDLLRGPMEAALRREALPQALEGLEVAPAQTGEALGDYAAILVALYAQGVDPLAAGGEDDPRVLAHWERLFERYPQLEGCREDVLAAYRLLRDCFQRGGKLLAVGNGGSCADCEHIVGELMKGFYLQRPLAGDLREAVRRETEALLPGAADMLQQGLPAIALTGHAALSTAFQNDVEPVLTAAQQVVGYGRPGDVLLGISTSGNAKNVALAVQTAKAMGIHTLGLAGGSGGRLKALCERAIVVPGSCPADVQELHLPVYHALCAMLEAKFFES